MIGLLEIIAGELETGVIRFLAVSVKTFVLSVGSAVGLTLIVRSDVYGDWSGQFTPGSRSCGTMDLDDQWWRVPLYVLCSVSVLGQYRFIISDYIAGLLVQVAAYEAQYRTFNYFDVQHRYDGMDNVLGNLAGAIAAVISASLVCYVIDRFRRHFRLTVTHSNYVEDRLNACGKFTRRTWDFFVRLGEMLGLGRGVTRRANKALKKLEKTSKEEGKAKRDIELLVEEERDLVEAAIEAQEFNVWSLLMPAVYQLVPGSAIAQVWYNRIFPLEEFEGEPTVESAEYALWLTSVSIALGLIIGLTIVRVVAFIIYRLYLMLQNSDDEEVLAMKARISREYDRQGVTHESDDADPGDNYDWSKEFAKMYENGNVITTTFENDSSPA